MACQGRFMTRCGDRTSKGTHRRAFRLGMPEAPAMPPAMASFYFTSARGSAWQHAQYGLFRHHSGCVRRSACSTLYGRGLSCHLRRILTLDHRAAGTALSEGEEALGREGPQHVVPRPPDPHQHHTLSRERLGESSESVAHGANRRFGRHHACCTRCCCSAQHSLRIHRFRDSRGAAKLLLRPHGGILGGGH